MSFNTIYSMPYNGGPYYLLPIPNTYPPQQYKMPVNGTAIATTPTLYHHHYPATPWMVLPNHVAFGSHQPNVWCQAVSA